MNANRAPHAAPRNTGNTSPLARRRMAAGLTQKQLGALVGSPQKNVSAWERGAVVPGLHKRQQLAQALECAVDDITAPPKEDKPKGPYSAFAVLALGTREWTACIGDQYKTINAARAALADLAAQGHTIRKTWIEYEGEKYEESTPPAAP